MTKAALGIGTVTEHSRPHKRSKASAFMKHIISASRRTDIPHYYSEWFAHRRRAGFAEFCNVFGGFGRASLRPEDVAGYLFWTRYARPFRTELQALQASGVPFAFQYTITGLGGTSVEPHIPRTQAAIDDFLWLRDLLPGPKAIEWRYDPLVISRERNEAWHLDNFAEIAARLAGATRIVNTSFLEPYRRTLRRMRVEGDFVYRQGVDPAVERGGGRMPVEAARNLLQQLSTIAGQHGIGLRVCSNPEFDLPASRCISAEIFADYGVDVFGGEKPPKPAPARPGCRCLKAIDIGMDNTCIGGCKYCYVVTSQNTTLANRARHDPTAPMLRMPASR